MDMNVAQKLDVSGGKIHIFADFQHRLHMKSPVGKFHMAWHTGHQPGSVLADFGVAAFGQNRRLAAFGGNRLIEHIHPRLALCRQNQPADFVSLGHILNPIQIGIIRLIVFVHLQKVLGTAGKGVDNIAVLAVKGRLAHGDHIQRAIPMLIPRQPVRQGFIDAIGDSFGLEPPVNHIPVDLLADARRRKHQHPGRQLVGGKIKPELRVQVWRRIVLPGLRLVQPRKAGGGKGLPQAGHFLFGQALWQNPLFIQTNAGRGYLSLFFACAQGVQPIQRMVRRQLNYMFFLFRRRPQRVYLRRFFPVIRQRVGAFLRRALRLVFRLFFVPPSADHFLQLAYLHGFSASFF